MGKTISSALPTVAVDYDATLIMAVETSNKSWVVAAHVPGLGNIKAKQTIEPATAALATSIEGYRRRAAAFGKEIDRVIVVYEAGYGGFWLARWLMARGVEVHVIQPSSVPVERRKRRAKSDKIDADLLLRTLMAWLRGEPRVCSMVMIPEEAEEDARRPSREREELVRERIMLTNRIGAILATVGVEDYNPLRRDRRVRLEALRTALDQPLPEHAKAKIVCIIERLELVLSQISALETQRDAVLEEEAPEEAQRMIKALVLLRSIGTQSATVFGMRFIVTIVGGLALSQLLTALYDAGHLSSHEPVS
ncbi:transposase [Methylosinus sp. H3A]|nr:transposase [Methylosinus sp. H3A]